MIAIFFSFCYNQVNIDIEKEEKQMAKFCSNCGSKIQEGAAFCVNCGYKIIDQPDSTPKQAPIQNSAQPRQDQAQPPQPYAGDRAPYPQQPAPQQPKPSYNQPPQKPKRKTGLIVGLIVGGSVLTLVAIVVIIFIVLTIRPGKVTPTPTISISATQQQTQAPTQAGTEEAPAKKPTQAPTQAPTEASAPPTEAPSPLPYIDSLGSIAPTDFAWIADAQSGNMTGNVINRDGLIGKWKAEFVFDGIWELVYITVDRDGVITVEPYQINYGGGWEDESDGTVLSYSGTFDTGSIVGSGEYGTIDLYQFIEINGTQYGIGELYAQKTGKTAEIYLVRP